MYKTVLPEGITYENAEELINEIIIERRQKAIRSEQCLSKEKTKPYWFSGKA